MVVLFLIVVSFLYRYKNIVMSGLGNWLKNIEAWVSNEFKDFQSTGDKIAVAITADIQAALQSGVVDGIASVIGAVFPSVKELPVMVVSELKIIIPKLLASELAIEGLPADPTEDDLQTFAGNVEKTFGVADSHSKLWTTLAAQVYGILQGDTTLSFASLVVDVETAYQKFIAVQATGS